MFIVESCECYHQKVRQGLSLELKRLFHRGVIEVIFETIIIVKTRNILGAKFYYCQH